MVTLFWASLSYISVVWLKLGMVMAGTLARVMVRLTGLAWLAPGTKVPATT